MSFVCTHSFVDFSHKPRSLSPEKPRTRQTQRKTYIDPPGNWKQTRLQGKSLSQLYRLSGMADFSLILLKVEPSPNHPWVTIVLIEACERLKRTSRVPGSCCRLLLWYVGFLERASMQKQCCGENVRLSWLQPQTTLYMDELFDLSEP